jgi:hypothetical protein
MDNTEKFLESLSLDPDSLARQFMSFSAFVNILLASAMGFMILAVYLASSPRERRDGNLSTVIPLLCVLMAVVMRIEGTQVLSFFGIFGILSVVRFRSDITDQKGITFILFAVIEGVIIGVNAYLLSLLAWIVVSGAILLGRYLLGGKTSYRLVARLPKGDGAAQRAEILAWLDARGVSASLSGFSAASEYSAKGERWDDEYKAEFALFPKDEGAFIPAIPEFIEAMRSKGIQVDLKRRDAF